MRLADYNVLFIIGYSILTLGCEASTKNEDLTLLASEKLESKTIVDSLGVEDQVIIDSANLIGPRQHYYFDSYDLSLKIPNELELDNYSQEYYEYSSHEELSAKFVVIGDGWQEDKELPLTNESILNKLIQSLAHYTYDRKGIVQINGVKFALLMGHNYSESLDEIQYLFTLIRPVGDHIIRLRFNDASVRYNYTPEEALDQMRATANQLFASIKIKGL